MEEDVIALKKRALTQHFYRISVAFRIGFAAPERENWLRMMEHCLLPEPSTPCLTYIYFVMNCQRHQTIMQVVNSYIQLQFQLVSSEITLGNVCTHSIFVCKSEVPTVVATCDAVTK
jgi:hypothetical protein